MVEAPFLLKPDEIIIVNAKDYLIVPYKAVDIKRNEIKTIKKKAKRKLPYCKICSKDRDIEHFSGIFFMKKVITYGTFDLFHRGHYNILKRAKEHGDYLIVGVTGESYDLERGKLNVRDSLLTRIQNVRNTGFADEIIVEEYQGQKINDILKYDIDTLVIGSDWRGKFDYLKKYCEVLYLERTKDISSTQIRETSEPIYNLGIITDDFDDGSIVEESLYVSGIHANGVCCTSQDTLDEFKEKFELNVFTLDYDELLRNSDVVYVRSSFSERAKHVKRALSSGKHVIVEPPFTFDKKEAEEIFDLAKENSVVFTERITIAYLRAFTQLVWFLHGGIIGDVVNLKISAKDRENSKESLLRLSSLALFASYKILNTNYLGDFNSVFFRTRNNGYYNFISLAYESMHAAIDISSVTHSVEGLEVLGTDGSIYVPDDWWNIGYFEIKKPNETHPKRYSFNFEGNGFRYLLQDFLISINSMKTRFETTKLFATDSYALIDALNSIRMSEGIL